MSDIEGKVVVITGASSGIGEATARLLASSGARVVVGARRTERLETLVADITRSGGSARFRAVDVTKRADVQAFVDYRQSRIRRGRRARQQRRRDAAVPADRSQGRRVGPDDRRQYPRRPARDRCRVAGHEGARRRPDHQRRLDRRPRGGADRRRLLRHEICGVGDLRGPAPGEHRPARDGDLARRRRIRTCATPSPMRRRQRSSANTAASPSRRTPSPAPSPLRSSSPHDVDVSEIIVRPTASPN